MQNCSKTYFTLIILFIAFDLQGQTCNGYLGENVFTEGNFGSGIENIIVDDPQIAPGYIYDSNPPPENGYYTITNNTGVWSGLFEGWFSLTDNSNNPDGYMMIVNASFEPGLFYEHEVTNLCENTIYSFSADLINLVNIRVSNSTIYPNVDFLIDGVVFYETGDVPIDEQWHNYSFTYVTGSGQTELVLSLRNNAPGGSGNDIGIDNISFKPCGPETNILPNDDFSICLNEIFTLEAQNINSPNQLDYIQWQLSNDGIVWEDIDSPTSNLTIELLADFQNYYYRYKVSSSSGNLSNLNCFVTSEIIQISVLDFDECGICDDNPNNNNESCIDCLGVLNGNNTIDECGICDDNPNNDNESCTDCLGVLNGNNTMDECGICDDNPNNNNESCTDCLGVLNGNNTIDECGVCDDDTTNNNTCFLIFPNAFSPNNDGINDLFKPLNRFVLDYSLKIFNRWGQKVFESDNIDFGWNGDFNGKAQELGVYVYQITYSTSSLDLPLAIKGNVTLVR